MTWRVIVGDCVEVMSWEPADSIDAIVTDPPYGLEFMGKEWDRLDTGLPQEQVWKGRRGAGGSHIGTDDSKPSSRHRVALGAGKQHGFNRCRTCGKRQFSGTPCRCPEPDFVLEYRQEAPSSSIRMQRWHEAWAREAYRVLKPGAHLLAFGGTRTYHRLVCALEDAGFEIRDTLAWMYGSGFPKSLDVSKAIDKAAGAEREVVGRHIQSKQTRKPGVTWGGPGQLDWQHDLTAPATPAAQQWQGWGTALKPAFEPIVLARKPLSEKTVAANVQRWGTGALNIDGTRIGTDTISTHGSGDKYARLKGGESAGVGTYESHTGRWPANVLLDEQAAALLGSASRYFYTAKASRRERTGYSGPNDHPTVKPVALMRWLVKLITLPEGVVLDPFMGTGTTGIAAVSEGFGFVGIDQDEGYVALAERRIHNEAGLFSVQDSVK